jgi:uncharacterized integral membrane protein
MLYLLFALVFSLAVAAFAIQNSLPVTVSFVTWSFQTSLVIVILGSAIFGALAIISLAVPMQIKARWDLKKCRQHLGELEAEVKTLQERLNKEQLAKEQPNKESANDPAQTDPQQQ